MRTNLFFGLLTTIFLLTACSPKQPTVAERRAEQHRQDSLSLIQQERSLRYTDSLLQATLPLVDPLLKRFEYEKRDAYEDHGHYVHRLLRTTSNTVRCFLQPYIFDDFRTTIRSYYYGSKAIRHTRLVLSADSLTYAAGGRLHTFEAEGAHEILTIEDAGDVQSLLRFIDAYSAGRIRVQLFADGHEKPSYTYYLSDIEKKALIDTYALSVLMNDIHQLERQQRQASLEIEKYQRRLQKQANSVANCK